MRPNSATSRPGTDGCTMTARGGSSTIRGRPGRLLAKSFARSRARSTSRRKPSKWPGQDPRRRRQSRGRRQSTGGDDRSVGHRPVAAQHAGRRRRSAHRQDCGSTRRRLYDQDNGRRAERRFRSSEISQTIFTDDDAMVRYLRASWAIRSPASPASMHCFFCIGDGSNGKGVFMGTVRGILGDYHPTARSRPFTADRTTSSTRLIWRCCAAHGW